MGELAKSKTLNRTHSKQYLDQVSKMVQKYIKEEEDGRFMPLMVSSSVVDQRTFLVIYYTPKTCLSRLSKPMMASLRNELYDAYVNFQQVTEATQASAIPNHAATHVTPTNTAKSKKKTKGVKQSGVIRQQPSRTY